MAYACRCKFCGRQETAHQMSLGTPEEDAEKWRGFRLSLANCPGYVSKTPRLEAKLRKAEEDFEADCFTTRMNGSYGREADSDDD